MVGWASDSNWVEVNLLGIRMSRTMELIADCLHNFNRFPSSIPPASCTAIAMGLHLSMSLSRSLVRYRTVLISRTKRCWDKDVSQLAAMFKIGRLRREERKEIEIMVLKG